MLHKEIPFFRICVALCAGIVSGLYYQPGSVLFFLLPALIILLFSFLIKARSYSVNHTYGIIMIPALALSGNLLYSIEKSSLPELESKPSVFGCVLSDYPEEKPATLMLRLRLVSDIPNGEKNLKGSMLIYLRKDDSSTDFIPGDSLVIRCIPQRIENRGNPFEFDYRFYMENMGIRYFAFAENNDIRKHVTPRKRSLTHTALIIRHRIIEMYNERGVSEKRLPLVAAITLGEKRMLDPGMKDNFIKAGVMHIMAVSGLHAVILSMFVFNLLFFLRKKYHIIRVLITILLLWMFAFVTGLTPSVMRATIMYSFLQAGSLMHRRVNGINSVLASAFVLIVIRPSVIFDAGFLLSYSAVIFIIAFYRQFYILLDPPWLFLRRVWQSVSVTMVAQAGTLPLTIMLFNRFPPYFLLTNIIIVPLSSFAVILGCIVPLLYPVGPLSFLSGLLLDRVTGLMELITEKAASLPSSSIENIGMTAYECIILALLIFALCRMILGRRRLSALLLTLCLVYALAVSVKYFYVSSTNEIIVYNTPGSFNAGLRSGRKIFIYTDTAVLNPDVRKHCATLGLKPELQVTLQNRLLSAGDKLIMISPFYDIEPVKKYKPDFLILAGSSGSADTRSLPGRCILIIQGSSGPWKKPDRPDIFIHSVRESGAYIQRL